MNADNSLKPQTYYSFDVLKFIMSIIVVYIHSGIYDSIDNILLKSISSVITPCCVPIFFLISGFLIFCTSNDEYRLKSSLIKYIKMYLIWNLIYLPFSVSPYFYNKNDVFYCIKDYLYGFFVLGEHFYSWPLWYLMAGIYAMALILLLKKCKIKKWMIVVFSVVLYTLKSILSFLNVELPVLFSEYLLNGRFLLGFLFISVGMFIAEYINLKEPKPIKILSIVLTLLCFLIQVIQPNQIIFVLLCISVFFICLSNSNIEIKSNVFFRKSSTVVFFTHMIFYFVWNILLDFDFPFEAICGFVFSTAGSLTLSYVVYSLQKKTKCQLLNLLFN